MKPSSPTPRGSMKTYSLDEYVTAGCAFYENSRPVFALVWMGTQGKVCDTGCAVVR